MRLKKGNDREVTHGPKGRCAAKAEQISAGLPSLPFLLEHKFTGTAGAAGIPDLQCYNQIIIFVTAQVLLLPLDRLVAR